MAVTPNKQFTPLRLPGMKGWNAYDDPSGIDDLELVDIQNMSYEKGFLARREGSTFLYTKPDGETGNGLQLITADTSDGVQYTIAVYANHFYLRHPVTDEWVRINQTYVPVETTRFYGYVNWNNGRGDDRLYVCNGVDDFARWDICVSQANGAQAAGSATVSLIDGTRFPAVGTLILKSVGGTFFTQAYTSRSGNVFTLTTPLTSNVPDQSSATLDMIKKTGMEIGKHVSKYQSRLIVANYYGGETSFFYSVLNDPEDFTPASTVAGGGSEVIADGNGEITGLHDFGSFLVIEKEDSIHSFGLITSSDLSSKLSQINPMVSGQSVGPLDQGSVVRVLNTLYYPTESNGFVSLYPDTTGSQVTATPTILSQKVDPYVQNTLSLSSSRSATNRNKMYWAVAAQGGSQNILVLEYDVLRKAWTKHFGWAVKDFTVMNDTILYLDNGSGSIYSINNGMYHDDNNPYLASASFKRFDYGEIGRPKTQDVIFLQGYMTPASEFFVDVLFNEGGLLEKQTFKINKDTPNLYFSDPITTAQGQFLAGEPTLGGVSLLGIGEVSIFRCYLGINISNGFYSIQPIVYGSREAFFGITAMAMDPELLPTIPVDFLIAPIAS